MKHELNVIFVRTLYIQPGNYKTAFLAQTENIFLY